jgi:hypothetical protein
MVEVPKVVELETIVPQLVKINEVIKEFIDKIITVPVVQEVIKEVPVEVEKIVQVLSQNTEVREVEVIKEKTVVVDKFVEHTNTVNHVEKEIQIVDRFEQKEVPIYTTVEKIVEVPQILEKIVERIVIYPQIVEVLKYVHEIYEDDGLGVALTGDIQVAELRYRELYGNAKKQLEILLVELRTLRNSNPNLRGIIEIIERFLLDFDRLAAAQRVVAVDREKIVEKEVSKGVLVPVNNIRNELAMSLLVENSSSKLNALRRTILTSSSTWKMMLPSSSSLNSLISKTLTCLETSKPTSRNTPKKPSEDSPRTEVNGALTTNSCFTPSSPKDSPWPTPLNTPTKKSLKLKLWLNLRVLL